MVKSEENAVFKLGDIVTVCLHDITIMGIFVYEDRLGMVIHDIKDKTKLRFIPWECVIYLEYYRK